jgi:hypothetical protein
MRDAAGRSRRDRRTLPTHYLAANRNELDELRAKPQRAVVCRPAVTRRGCSSLSLLPVRDAYRRLTEKGIRKEISDSRRRLQPNSLTRSSPTHRRCSAHWGYDAASRSNPRSDFPGTPQAQARDACPMTQRRSWPTEHLNPDRAGRKEKPSVSPVPRPASFTPKALFHCTRLVEARCCSRCA